MKRSIALRSIVMVLAVPLLFVSTLSAKEITASRVQAESKAQAYTTRIFQPAAEPVVNTTPNALRHDGNTTVTYDVSVPAGASVDAVTVRSRCASTCTGGVGLFVVVNGTFQAGKNVAANAQTFTEYTWTLANPLGPGTHRIGLRTGSTTTTNRVISDYLYLEGTEIPPPPVDTDGDGVPDDADQCDNNPGPISNNGCPTDLPTHQARTAQDFMDSLGLHTQLKDQASVYGRYETVIRPALAELGITHIRDLPPRPTNAYTAQVYARYADLCSSLGVKTTVNIGDAMWPTPPTAAELDDLLGRSGCAIEAWEGPNEYNNGRSGDGVWDEELEAWQEDLFNSVNASNSPDIPLLAAPLGKGHNNDPPPEEMPELGPFSDLNSMHSYPSGSMPTGSHMAGYVSTLFQYHIPPSIQVGAAGRGIYATETGYTTAASHVNRVSETARTKYLPRLVFEYFNAGPTHGVARIYLFQLANNKTPDPTVAQAHYGLLDYQGRWEPSGKVVENMVDIVDEPEGVSYTAGTLDYEITGESAAVHTALLQKRDGAFYLALWKEVPSYDRRTDQDLTVPADIVTVNFDDPKNLSVFSPRDVSDWAPGQDAEANPERTLTGMSITEPVDDEVTIIRIT